MRVFALLTVCVCVSVQTHWDDGGVFLSKVRACNGWGGH